MADHPVQQDSKYRVAFDLMSRMTHSDPASGKADAIYWLKHYEAALTVVSHGSAEEAAKRLPK